MRWLAPRWLLVVALAAALCAPDVATAARGDLVEGVLPAESGVPTGAMPEVKMRAGLLCTQDGRVLWSRAPRDRRAMASITKIMTAIVVIENAGMNEEVTISKFAKTTGFSSSFLQVGQKITVYELLEAMLVRSGNDAAVALAEHVGGNEDAFVRMMNEKAAELGLTRTYFTNAHGLDQSGHYSTAEDLAVMARYAMSRKEFRQIVAQKSCVVSAVGSRETAENTNLLIGNYQGANGVKTGWTDNAGYSVVASAERDGIELYAVILGTTGEIARFKAARELLDWGFIHYRHQQLASKGTIVGASAVVDYINSTVPAAVSEDASLPVFDLAGPIKRSARLVDVAAPVAVGQDVGVLSFTQGGKVIATVPLLAADKVRAPTWVERVGIAIARSWRRLRGQPLQASSTPSD